MPKTHNLPKVFISYSWEDRNHKEWVKRFADHLLRDGVDVVIDQYDLCIGDRMPAFMEQISMADYVLVICTPAHKEKADMREGGVGYESNIITGEMITERNESKFLPILRKGDFKTALPVYMQGKMAIDLRHSGFDQESYIDLLTTLYSVVRKPVLGGKPKYIDESTRSLKTPSFRNGTIEEEPIFILGIITNEVTMLRMDGTRGCALYKAPFRLSRRPSDLWARLFIIEWNHPKCFSTMHRPGMASVKGDRIILDGTTVEEVRDVHRDTLVLCVEEANERERTPET